ncbi:alpha/beta hydrolase [Metasolibacillus meyeri]|uniref:alpha/beta hydrolase n=1 Tax=Metasolibacillus meyeri TaxID=1071052 RepID=UPI000D2FE403|nr:alpha/beta hydrolase [Metasolibacillus meyeri]
MQHIFEHGTNGRTLLLLHGTGGTERDLIGLAKEIDANANILSVRGNVLENGMPRFFRRVAEGVFDMEDLFFRTKELHDFVQQASVDYQFDHNQIIAIGYSNGANIAGSLLFHHENSLRAAILHHPMVPNRDAQIPSLQHVDVWIGAGTNDFMCPAQESEQLEQMLKAHGANVETAWFHDGHQLTMPEVQAAKAWYTGIFK